MAVKYLWLCGRCATELEAGLNLKKVDDSKLKMGARNGKKCEYCKKALSPDVYMIGAKL